MSDPGAHISVLLSESVNLLINRKAGTYVDATFGRGGHSQAILDGLADEGRLVALDQDDAAVTYGERLAVADKRFSIHKQNFGQVSQLMTRLGLADGVDGLLLDLGVSSPQIDDAGRGFSFQNDGPLDMRMDQQREPSAARWVAEVTQADLVRVLRDYGEERYASRIARAIIASRLERPITTTGQLAEIIKQAHPRWEKHHHPATRSFQAIRIAINGELDVLRDGLRQARDVVRTGGRLVVISFHSLEDRLVKREIRGDVGSQRLPSGVLAPPKPRYWRALGKAVFPSAQEVQNNPRSRSSVLRVAERLAS